MHEPPPQNHDKEIPSRTGEKIGDHEPPARKRGTEGERHAPLPEEESSERDDREPPSV